MLSNSSFLKQNYNKRINYKTYNWKLLAIINIYEMKRYNFKVYKNNIFIFIYHKNILQFINIKNLS